MQRAACLGRSLSQPPAGHHQTVVGGPLRTGRGSPCVRGGVCFHMSVEMVSDHRPVCICGRASSCGGTGVTDASRPRGRGLGLVSPCPTATFSFSRTSVRSLLGPVALLSIPGPWPGGACSAVAILGGPGHRKVTAGEGSSAPWPGALRDLDLADFCPTFSQRDVCRCWDAHCVTTSLSCDFCLCSSLLSLGSEEMKRALSLGPPGVMGLGSTVSSAGEPDPSSVPPPCRGGSEKEGVRDPAFWAGKAEKAEVEE